MPGLRVGLAGQTFEVSEGLLRPPGEEERWRVWTASIEWRFRRVILRAEGVDSHASTSDYRGYYAQAGIHLTPELTLNLQVEAADLQIDSPGLVLDLDYDRSEGVGMSYAFSSNLVGKTEVHHSEGYFHVEDPQPSFFGDPRETVYGILSLAVSF